MIQERAKQKPLVSSTNFGCHTWLLLQYLLVTRAALFSVWKGLHTGRWKSLEAIVRTVYGCVLLCPGLRSGCGWYCSELCDRPYPALMEFSLLMKRDTEYLNWGINRVRAREEIKRGDAIVVTSWGGRRALWMELSGKALLSRGGGSVSSGLGPEWQAGTGNSQWQSVPDRGINGYQLLLTVTGGTLLCV